MPMQSKRSLAVLISTSLSAGCVVGPDYSRPELAMPEHFMGQATFDQRPAHANPDLIAWWKGFGDPQLTRFVTLAL
jgi:outer membrane protein TolC